MYSLVFSDTAVALKCTQTPMRAKKLKPTVDLGCTPLTQSGSTCATLTATSYAISQPAMEDVTQI